MQTEYKETTKQMLRPHQVEDMKEEAKRIEKTLSAPPHILNQIQDTGEMRRQLRKIAEALETQEPKQYRRDEMDAAIQREAELREQWMQGMPTQAEMRRNPVGAVDKHRKWEKRSKEAIMEWKNIRLRMHQSGMLDELPDAKDVASIERFRPVDASHELNMHNEQISPKVQHGPHTLTPSTVFSDRDMDLLGAIDPEISSQLALMNNDQRAAIKDYMKQVMEAGLAPEPETRGGWTPERRAEASRKAKERWAKKQAEKE